MKAARISFSKKNGREEQGAGTAKDWIGGDGNEGGLNIESRLLVPLIFLPQM